ncbi:hypothetical protein H4R35_003386 [Dimargaris xerosporica]|nr:hypothetical protein H4R35_003386 [Dimargaris xerosporica]
MAYNQGPVHSVLFDGDNGGYDPNAETAYTPQADYDDPQGTYTSSYYYQQPVVGQSQPQDPPAADNAGSYGLQFYNSQYDTPASYDQSAARYDAGGASGTLDPSQGAYGPGPAAFDPYPVEVSFWAAFGSGGLPGEAPLMEELGINFGHVRTKSWTVLNPMRAIPRDLMDDADMAGPLLFCLLFGTFLLFSGKAHFGYIYGVGLLGCLSVYLLLNLMSESGIDGYRTTSVLGYSLLPLVILSGISMLLKLSSTIGYILSSMAVLWCTFSASTLFVTTLSMSNQRLLVAYPVGLFYTCFALMTVF